MNQNEILTQPLQWIAERNRRLREQWIHDLKVDAFAILVTLLVVTCATLVIVALGGA